jgi:hypothetical protein
VECGYADFREPFFPVFGNRLGEKPLEAHQLLPVNLKLLGLNSFTFIRRIQSRASAAPTRTFLGSHPRSAQVPPNGLESTTVTSHPAERHRDATADAADPVPMTARSNFLVILLFLSTRADSGACG